MGVAHPGHRKSQSQTNIKRNDSVSIIVHDFAVVGPIPASNISLAKGLAAELAQQIMQDPDSPYLLKRICDCTRVTDPAAAAVPVVESVEEALLDPDPAVAQKKLDDETEAGFAALARMALTEAEGRASTAEVDQSAEVLEDEDMDGVPIPEEIECEDNEIEHEDTPNEYEDQMDIDS